MIQGNTMPDPENRMFKLCVLMCVYVRYIHK